MDIYIMNFVQNNFHNGFTDFIFPIITTLGNSGLIWILISACLLVTKKYRRQGILLLAALLLTHVLGEWILKPVVARPRPFVAFPGHNLLIPPPSGYSFPSGHSASSFAAATVLWGTNKKFGVPAFLLAILIAFSRVFLFVHYPTDILAGAILGVLCARLVCHLYNKNQQIISQK